LLDSNLGVTAKITPISGKLRIESSTTGTSTIETCILGYQEQGFKSPKFSNMNGLISNQNWRFHKHKQCDTSDNLPNASLGCTPPKTERWGWVAVDYRFVMGYPEGKESQGILFLSVVQDFFP
jgi:hypothetical protein